MAKHGKAVAYIFPSVELGERIFSRFGEDAHGGHRVTRRRDLLLGLGIISSAGRIAVARATDPQAILGTRRVAAWIADSDDGRSDFAVFLARLSELGWQQGPQRRSALSSAERTRDRR
jgi:hypothetical protein